MLDKSSLKRIASVVHDNERTAPSAMVDQDRRPEDQTFARVALFEIPSGGTWVEVSGDKWQMVDCREVIKTATTTWTATDYRPTQTVWFIPELFGDGTKDPNAGTLSDWVLALYDHQSDRWIAVVGGGAASDQTTTTTDDGSFTCCACTNSKLFVYLENYETVSWEKITFPKSLVSSGSIVHKIRLTCKSDGSTLDVTLPALACEETDCQVLDLTGTAVGVCDAGKIYFGNSSVCVPVVAPDTKTDCESFDPMVHISSFEFTGVEAGEFPDADPFPVSPDLVTFGSGFASFQYSASNYSIATALVPESIPSKMRGELKFEYDGNTTTAYNGTIATEVWFEHSSGFFAQIDLRVSKVFKTIEILFQNVQVVSIPLDEASHVLSYWQHSETELRIEFDGVVYDVTFDGEGKFDCSTISNARIFAFTQASPPTTFDPLPSFFRIDYWNQEWF